MAYRLALACIQIKTKKKQGIKEAEEKRRRTPRVMRAGRVTKIHRPVGECKLDVGADARGLAMSFPLRVSIESPSLVQFQYGKRGSIPVGDLTGPISGV